MLTSEKIRVWGGGIVESDDFYEICDREGILVWQDFLFACGDYPASPDFLAAVKAEDEGHVKRVGHHASMYLLLSGHRLHFKPSPYSLAELC